MNMTIERRPEYDRIHCIDTEDVILYGMEKACILSNINRYPNTQKENLHEKFKYIPKEDFYRHLEELQEMELVWEVE
jgi:hypothetical protein